MIGMRAYARHRKELGLPGTTHRAVQVAIASGRLSASVTKTGKIRSIAKADAEWAAATKADHAPLTGPTAPKPPPAAREPAPVEPQQVNDLAAARARREGVNADLAEIDLAKTRGELVLARDVEARFADVFLRCRTRLLGMIVRAREADPTLTETQLRLIETLLRDALGELATTGGRGG